MILLIRLSGQQEILSGITRITERRTDARTLMTMFKGEENLGEVDLSTATVELLPEEPRVG